MEGVVAETGETENEEEEEEEVESSLFHSLSCFYFIFLFLQYYLSTRSVALTSFSLSLFF